MNGDYLKDIARGWSDLQGKPRKLVPAQPLHKGREYHNAASHGDSAEFRQRQIERGMKVRT